MQEGDDHDREVNSFSDIMIFRCAKPRRDVPSTPSLLRIMLWSPKSASCCQVSFRICYSFSSQILLELLEPVTMCENCVSGPSDCQVSRFYNKYSKNFNTFSLQDFCAILDSEGVPHQAGILWGS